MAEPPRSQAGTQRPGASTTTTNTTVIPQDGGPIAGLSVPQVVGGALAAVTTAVAASSLGVAGTLIGAAVASIITTLATTIYSNSLSHAARISRTLVVRRAVAPERPQGASPSASDQGPTDEAVVEYTTKSGVPAPDDAAPEQPLWQRIRWKPVALVAGLVFVASMAVVSISELALGHPLSNSRETGTTLSNLGGSSQQTTSTPTTTPTSSSTATPTDSGTATPTPTSSPGLGDTSSTTAPTSGTTTGSPSGTSSSGGPRTTAPGGGATTSSSSAPGAAPPASP